MRKGTKSLGLANSNRSVLFKQGTSGKRSNVIVLGALCQLKNNKYSLEDPTGLVDLDLSEAKFHRGLYTENCFVLVEGWYEDLVFHVVAMGHPPVEKSEVSLTNLSGWRKLKVP